jgi:hypothetical protein
MYSSDPNDAPYLVPGRKRLFFVADEG